MINLVAILLNPLTAPLLASGVFGLAQFMPQEIENLDVIGVLIFVVTNMVWMFVRDRNHRNEMEARDQERDRRMEKTLNDKEAEFRQIMNQIVDERDIRIAKLEDVTQQKERQMLQVISDNQVIAQRNSSLETLNERYRAEIDDLRNRVTSKEESIQRLNDRVSEIQERHQEEKIEWESERQTLLKELDESRNVRDVVVPELRREIAALRAEVEKVQANEAKKDQELQAANARLMQEMDEKQVLQNEVSRLSAALAEANKRIGELEKLIEGVTSA